MRQFLGCTWKDDPFNLQNHLLSRQRSIAKEVSRRLSSVLGDGGARVCKHFVHKLQTGNWRQSLAPFTTLVTLLVMLLVRVW